MKKIKNLLYVLFVFLFLLFGLWMTADAQTNYKQDGNTFSSIKTTKTVSPEKTDYLWKDSKGNVYPIYISSTGSCFVIKTSSKTGKEYRQYLGPELSEEICKKLGKEYKTKTKSE